MNVFAKRIRYLQKPGQKSKKKTPNSVKFTTYFSVLFMEKKFNILINFSDVDGVVDVVAIVVTRC